MTTLRGAFFATALAGIISADSAAGRGSSLPELTACRQPYAGARGQQRHGAFVPPESITGPLFGHYQPVLDSFARHLKEEADAKLFVFVYGGRVGRRRDVGVRVKCIREYLLRRHGLDSARVVVEGGGHRERITVDIFLRREGQPEPKPSPTIDPRDVKVTKRGRGQFKCKFG